MAGKKRDRLELIYDILMTVRRNGNQVGPTKLLQASNLSSQMFRDYINELLDKEFIEEIYIKNKKKYALINKGNEFIDKFREIKEFMEGFGL